MQIQLKQLEIEKALKAYITGLGIDLSGKTVTIAFTSGRKDNGLSADIEFEDAVIPGYSDGTALTAVPTPSQPQQAKPLVLAATAINVELMSKVDADIQTSTGMPDLSFAEPTSTASIKPVSLFSK